MKNKLLLSSILLLIIILTGCNKEEKSEYNAVNINAGINTAKEISNIIVANKSFDDVSKELEKYEYLFPRDIYQNNFDFTKKELRYIYGFELDNARYIYKSNLQDINFGIEDGNGEYSVYLTQNLYVDYTEEFKKSTYEVVEDNLDYIKAMFIFKFDSNNKIKDYSMDFEYIYKKEKGE